MQTEILSAKKRSQNFTNINQILLISRTHPCVSNRTTVYDTVFESFHHIR